MLYFLYKCHAIFPPQESHDLLQTKLFCGSLNGIRNTWKNKQTVFFMGRYPHEQLISQNDVLTVLSLKSLLNLLF